MPKTVKLTKGKSAYVDDADYERVAQYRWYVRLSNRTQYARRDYTQNGKRVREYMHRFILGVLPTEEIDHIDGDGLNNTRANLRIVNHKSNTRNVRMHRDNSSPYKGVSWDRQRHRWYAKITVDGRMIPLGRYIYLEDAAQAYAKAAREYFGEFARLS